MVTTWLIILCASRTSDKLAINKKRYTFDADIVIATKLVHKIILCKPRIVLYDGIALYVWHTHNISPIN